MAYHDDPPELTAIGQKADPAPVKKPSHAKVAIVGPRKDARKAWDAAVIEVAAGRDELVRATADHRQAERDAGARCAEWAALRHPCRTRPMHSTACAAPPDVANAGMCQ
jgi:hypothetical protein